MQPYELQHRGLDKLWGGAPTRISSSGKTRRRVIFCDRSEPATTATPTILEIQLAGCGFSGAREGARRVVMVIVEVSLVFS